MLYLTDTENTLADLHNNSGVAKCRRGYFADGIDDFNKALYCDPKNFYSYLNRAAANRELGLFELANADLNKAETILNERQNNISRLSHFMPKYLISNNSKYTDLYNNSGVAKCEQGLLDRGIMDFDWAIYFDSNNAMTYYNRGLAKIQKGLRISGNADLRKAWDIYNRNTASRWNLLR